MFANRKISKHLKNKNFNTLFFKFAIPSYPSPIRFASGDTKLHQLIENETNPTLVMTELEKLDKKISRNMATTINDEGKLPLDLLNWNTSLNSDQKSFKNIKYSLMALMVEHAKETKNLTEPMEIFNGTSDQSNIPDTKKNLVLEQNLKFACEIGNEARSYIQYSTTHPTINFTSTFTQSITFNKSYKVRIEGEESNPHSYQSMERNSMLSMEHNWGNCHEYSQVCFHLSLKSGVEKPVFYSYILDLLHGDHVVFCLDQYPFKSIEELKNSQTAVICDAWYGKTFPISESKEILRNFRRISDEKLEKSWCITTNYNPNFHKMNLLASSIEREQKIKSAQENSFFSKENKNKVSNDSIYSKNTFSFMRL